MNKVLLITLLWIAVGFRTTFFFAQTSTESGKAGYISEDKGRLKKVPEPSKGFPFGIKCGFCEESHM